MRGTLYENWQREAEESLATLLGTLKRELVGKERLIKARSAIPQPSLLADYLTWRVDEDVRFLREVGLRLKQISDHQQLRVEDAGERLLVWLSTCGLHPATYQQALRGWLDVMARRPTLEQNLGERTDRMVSIWKDLMPGSKDDDNEQKSKKKD